MWCQYWIFMFTVVFFYSTVLNVYIDFLILCILSRRSLIHCFICLPQTSEFSFPQLCFRWIIGMKMTIIHTVCHWVQWAGVFYSDYLLQYFTAYVQHALKSLPVLYIEKQCFVLFALHLNYQQRIKRFLKCLSTIL